MWPECRLGDGPQVLWRSWEGSLAPEAQIKPSITQGPGGCAHVCQGLPNIHLAKLLRT